LNVEESEKPKFLKWREMTELNKISSNVPEKLLAKIWRTIYSYLASVKLAIALLIIILVCCVIGVTIVRGARAGALIFGTVWFNGLLVLLVVNVAFCFFGRIWGRKVTLISLGMILFHLSFVAMLGGIVYNSLFYFRGTIRLTEGETLPGGDLQSYDAFDHGRFFVFSKLQGETTLIKMHRDYSVDGADKQVAYEVAVGEGRSKKQGFIYVTHKLDNNGFDYFRDKEGYSLLILLYNSLGKELYGAHVPLQSLKQKDESYLYTTGTKEGPGPFPFPQDPLKPLFDLQVAYRPSLLKGRERDGEAFYQVWTLQGEDSEAGGHAVAEGKAAIGNRVNVGNYYLEAKEVRYWVGMNVRYEPGKPIVLTSLWVGLGGMILTFIGRMRRSRFEEKVA
jgi:cytochrome c biogenesis protein ResB